MNNENMGEFKEEIACEDRIHIFRECPPYKRERES